MKKYNFSMEKILEWKSTIEKEKIENFGKLQNQINYEESKLTELEVEIKDAKFKSMREINISKLRQHNLYIQSVEEKIQSQEKKIVDLRQALETKRLELVTAQKDRSIMEKLKEKDFCTYNKNIKSLEQRELDEIAVLRYKSVEAN